MAVAYRDFSGRLPARRALRSGARLAATGLCAFIFYAAKSGRRKRITASIPNAVTAVFIKVYINPPRCVQATATYIPKNATHTTNLINVEARNPTNDPVAARKACL